MPREPQQSNQVNLNNLNIGELPNRCCARCEFGFIIRDGSGKLVFQIRECREASPHVQFFAVAKDPRSAPTPDNTIVWEHSGHPKLPASHVCGRFLYKEGVSNAPLLEATDDIGGEA